MNNIITTPLTAKEAIDLTGRIKTAANQLWQLLLEAHERKAWRALGYQTWEAYVGAEFDMSRNHSYRLLNQGKVIRAIEGAAGVLLPDGNISEAATRDIKPVLDEVTEEIRTRVEQGADPVETTYEVIEAKRQERSQPADDEPDFGDSTPSEERNSKVVSLDERRQAKAEEQPAEYFEPDWLAELEHANAEIAQQQQLIESLQSDDLGKELAEWQQRYRQLEGRLRQAITTGNEAEKQARYYGNVLRQLRGMLGVDKTSELVARVKQMVGVAS